MVELELLILGVFGSPKVGCCSAINSHVLLFVLFDVESMFLILFHTTFQHYITVFGPLAISDHQMEASASLILS